MCASRVRRGHQGERDPEEVESTDWNSHGAKGWLGSGCISRKIRGSVGVFDRSRLWITFHFCVKGQGKYI